MRQKDVLFPVALIFLGFLLPAQYVKVETPNRSLQLNRGEYYMIYWSYSGLSGNISIELMKKSIRTGAYLPVGVIQRLPVLYRSFNWIVGKHSNGMESGGGIKNYRIKISTLDGRYTDMSDASFAISGAGSAQTVERREYTFPGSFLPLAFDSLNIHIDSSGSWLKYKPRGGGDQTLDLSIGEFTAKMRGRINPVKHRLQDINSTYWNINVRGGRLYFTIRFETAGPIEIKRYAKGWLGHYRDGYAYDVNLTRFNMTVSASVGSQNQPFSTSNVLNNVEVDLDLNADISNIPDHLEIWGIVDRKMRSLIRPIIVRTFYEQNLRENIYNAIIALVRQNLKNALIANVYSSGDNLIVKYNTPKL